MRHSSFLSVGLALLAACAAAAGGRTGAQSAPVEVTAEIVGQRYCAVSPALTSLQINLRVRYRNTGTQKLILYKGHDLFFQTKVRAAAPDAKGARPYEVTYLNSRYFDEEFEPIEQATPSRVFAVLRPGAAYEREMTVGVAVAGEGAERGVQAVAEGEHTLQLIISTWYKSRPLAEKLRARWQDRGLLLIDPVTTLPVKLSVKKPAAPPPCE